MYLVTFEILGCHDMAPLELPLELSLEKGKLITEGGSRCACKEPMPK